MHSGHLAVVNTGLVTSVGMCAPAACAAIRAGVANPSETRFIDSAGEWIMAHSVKLEEAWGGRIKLVKMAILAIEECLAEISRDRWDEIPLILCVAELSRPGRLSGLDDELFIELQAELGVHFAETSLVIAQGRVSAVTALVHARELIAGTSANQVVIAGTDSLLTWPTLHVYDQSERLLTSANPNGFIPGEGAGAVLLEAAKHDSRLTCVGIGFGTEPARIDLELPLRGDGLTNAVKAALADADCEMHHLHFRITDLSGEQFYFKEAALALGRTLRGRKEGLDIWHPADCIGETGAVAGFAMLAVAEAARRKNYAPGTNILAHMANDDGSRAAAVWHLAGVYDGQ